MQPAIARFFRKSAMTIPLVLGLSDVPLFSQSARPAAKPAHQLTIGFIHDTKLFYEEAGCSLWLLGDRPYSLRRVVLLSNFNGNAVINIGGRDTPLRLVDTTDTRSIPKKGDRTMYHYRGKGVDVVVRYIVTGVCAPDDEACEAEDYDATLTVKTSSGKRVVRATGICGS